MSLVLYAYGGVPLNPPAKSLAEADRRWREALAAGDALAVEFQRQRKKKARAFSQAQARSRSK